MGEAMIDQSELHHMDTAPRDGTVILIRFEHMNFKYAMKSGRDASIWEGLHEAHWIDHNNGGWTWHGIMGQATGWKHKPGAGALEDIANG